MDIYSTPDLTGSAENYAGSETFQIFEQDQIFEFGGPVHESSIVVTRASDGLELGKDVDWVVLETDTTTEAKLRSGSPTFTGSLVKSIKIIQAVPVAYKAAVAYQALFPTIGKVALAQDILTFDPTVYADTLRRLTAVELITGAGSSSLAVAANLADRRITLPIDTDKSRVATNLIVDEAYTVDVLNQQSLIRPQYGCFYNTSVIVKEADTNTVLTEGVDYVLSGINLEKTSQLQTEEKIYSFIHITNQSQKDLLVTYHAFGGETSPESLDLIRDKMVALLSYLQSDTNLTTDSLVDTPVVSSLLSRITSLEEQMRQLAIGATYGDTGDNGAASIFNLTAVDANFHWYTVAELYMVDGSPTIFKADRFEGRISFPDIGFLGNLAVTVDLDQVKPLRVETTGVVCDEGFDKDLVKEVDLTNVIAPVVRVIWNDPLAADHPGAYLQIGLAIPGGTTRLAMENISGNQAAWLLKSGGVTNPEDNNVLLPDGATTWISGNADSHSELWHVGRGCPYPAYIGTTTVVEGLQTLATDPVLLPFTTPLDQFREICVVYQNTDSTEIRRMISGTFMNGGGKLHGAVYIDVGVDANKNNANPDIMVLDVTIQPNVGNTAYEVVVRGNGQLSATTPYPVDIKFIGIS